MVPVTRWSMGQSMRVDHALTEVNREIVRAFVETVLVGQRFEAIADFADADLYTEHSPPQR